MGMFDWFKPDPPIQCPQCSRPVEGFQGKDGPCNLLVWTQGLPSPVDDPDTDDDWRSSPEYLAELRLPAVFEFYGSCDPCKQWLDFTGFCQNGVWTETVSGRHLSSGPTIPATSVAQDWRQCARCADAWQCSDSIIRAGCPFCGALTRLTPP
jgi:hypothetical protein